MDNGQEFQEALKQIGPRIKAVRRALNLNQGEYAGKLKISQPFLSYVEKGLRKPSFELLASLLLYFNVNLSWVLTGRGDMFLKQQEEEANPVKTAQTRFVDLFPGVPPEADVMDMIKSMEVPIMRNALVEKFLFYRKRYEEFISDYRDKHRKAVHNGG